MVTIRSVYDEHEHESGCTFTNPTMTQQHFKDECDINKIMQRYQVLGTPLVDPMVQPSGEPLFGDFSDLPTLQEAHNKLIEANEMFMSLPSSIRKRFGNDPIAFVDFCQNEENVAEMRELGILPKLYYTDTGSEYFFRDGQPVFTGNSKQIELEVKTEA